MISIEQRFRDNFKAKRLPDGIKRLGVAVSGGSDSIALVHLLQEISEEAGIELTILCFDHAIEGENSVNETEFVRRFALERGLPSYIERAEVPIKAANGKSMEMAAREERRAFFLRAAERCNLDAIAIGHQETDAAETLLIRLLRGAGTTGLSAMRSTGVIPGGKSGLKIIRPLLPFSRRELRDFLSSKSIKWMDDVSNANDEITRNRIRLKLVPTLAGIMRIEEEKVSHSIAQSVQVLSDEDLYLDKIAEENLSLLSSSEKTIDIATLRKTDKAIARRVLRLWLINNGLPEGAGFDYIEEILNTLSPSVNLPKDLAVVFENGIAKLTSQKKTDATVEMSPMILKIGEETEWGKFKIRISAATEIERPKTKLNQWPAVCTLSAQTIDGDIIVRTRRPGDTMEPYGIDGTKTIQDIFVNEKLPAEARSPYPIITVNGKIAWLPGYRIARSFAASPDTPMIKITICR